MSARDKQVDGSHYKDLNIQPYEYAEKNNLSFLEGNSIKYITRHRTKNGKTDLLKAIHCIELLISELYQDELVDQSGTLDFTTIGSTITTVEDIYNELKAKDEECERLIIESEVYYDFYKKLADIYPKDMLHFSGLRLEDMTNYLIKRLEQKGGEGE